jgi:protein O-mannosyl-transferase
MSSTRRSRRREARRRPGTHASSVTAGARELPSWVPALAVFILTLVVFAPAVTNGFITWDDDHNFLENPSFRGLGLAQLRWMWTTTLLGHYVPLTWMSLGLDFTLWGMNPAGYHLTNVVLHALTAVATYAVVLDMLRRTTPLATTTVNALRVAAAVAALFYALHPLRVESVAWVTERRDMLSQLFLVSAVLMYLRAHRDAWSPRHYAMSVALFLCALLSKASGASLPVVLLILDVYPLRRLGGSQGWLEAAARRVYVEKLPYIVLSAAAGIVSVLSLPARPQLGLLAKLVVSAYGVCFYLVKTVMPFALSPLYPMPERFSMQPVFVASCVALVVMACLAVLARRRWPGITTVCAIFIVLLLPLLGVVQNGPQIVADRYTYMASVALACVVGSAIVQPIRIPTRVRALAASALLIALSALTWRQIGVWHDSESFWSYVVQRAPGSAIAHHGVGDAVASRGDIDSAISEYRRATTLDSMLATSQNNLGVALFRQGKGAEALVHLRRALRGNANYPDAEMNLGTVLAALDSIVPAESAFGRALALEPRLAAAQFNWGNALFRRGDAAGAVVHYREATRLAPGQPEFAAGLLVAERRVRGAGGSSVPRK